MTDDLEIRAYDLLQHASNLPDDEREPYLSSFSAAEPVAVQLATQMLRDALAAAGAGPGSAVNVQSLPNREGSHVDSWTIGRRIGIGGSGVVYHATRPASGAEEHAALKFLDMAPRAVRRFLQERQILARLNHEGICKYIGDGATPEGVPYVAMEYVIGTPITSYCDYHNLTVTARLELFLQLCHAVEHAHQQGVLHRDLKPANILVTSGGALRVLDFGMSQLLDAGQDQRLRITRIGEAPWSKGYASPEQVSGERLSFAADVYSLGSVLYELVTGQHPFSPLVLSGPDWRRVIEEHEPLAPSRAVLLENPASGGAPSRPPETAATLRASVPSRLQRILAGNLDAVVLKAVKKSEKERYPNVVRLRRDIEKFLEGFPVDARQTRLWETGVNWFAKHKWAARAIVIWGLGMLTCLQVAMVQEVRYQSAVDSQRQAEGRLRYLLATGMDKVERTLPGGTPSRDARLLAVRIHTRLLEQVERLPEFTLRGLDSSLGESALQCARLWQQLGDTGSALAVNAPVLARTERRYRLAPRDRQWRDLYARLLRQRIALHANLGQAGDASGYTGRLAAIEARHE